MFLLGLLLAVESSPSTIAHHLSNLEAAHAAPASFTPSASESKPAETDAIVASLARIADRLKKAESSSRHETSDMGSFAEVTVAGNTVEEVRKMCEEQVKALKLLHAEELRRSQVSHDEEVR
jgi:hypothetical protein